jgi:hypothetical protein
MVLCRLFTIFILILISWTPISANDSEKSNFDLYNAFLLASGDGWSYNNLVFYITPKYREKALQYAMKTSGNVIKPRPWDSSNNFCVLATSTIVGFDVPADRYFLEGEIKSIDLLDKKTEKLLCQPLSTYSFRVTEEDVKYLSTVHQHLKKITFAGDLFIPVGTNAVLNEYDYHCLERKEKIRVFLNRKKYKSSKVTIPKKLRKIIIKEMGGQD